MEINIGEKDVLKLSGLVVKFFIFDMVLNKLFNSGFIFFKYFISSLVKISRRLIILLNSDFFLFSVDIFDKKIIIIIIL